MLFTSILWTAIRSIFNPQMRRFLKVEYHDISRLYARWDKLLRDAYERGFKEGRSPTNNFPASG